MKTIIACLLFAFVMMAQAYGQSACCPYMYPIEIIPAHPTTADSVRVVTVATTPNYGHRISYNAGWLSDTLMLTGCFADAWLSALRTYRDTTNVGLLQAGSYSVIYTASISQNDTICMPSQSNTVDTTFEVVALVVAAGEKLGEKPFCIYPNPATDFLAVNAADDATAMQVELRNAWGQVCYRATLNNGEKIDLRPFAKGMYWIVIQANDQRAAFPLRKD